MRISLKGKSILSLFELTPEEIKYLLRLALFLKDERRSGVVNQRFRGKTLALIFEKRSTRTRCAFETAFGEEGGYPSFLSINDIQLGSKETIEDTARILGRMYDAILFRGYNQKFVEILAEYSGVPVYNGLTDSFHPTQILADLMTIIEEFGELKGKKLVFIGDGRNNIANTLAVGCAKMGMNYTIIAPKELWPEFNLLDSVRKICQQTGGSIYVTENIKEGVDGADVVYTDVWVSMGEEDKEKERLELLKSYQVNQCLMKKTNKENTIFMHCLPAVRGQEVTSEIIDGKKSRVWDQAENRKHIAKAILTATLL